MVHLLKLKKEVSQDKTKAYIQSADIGHFSRMAHAFIGTNDKSFGFSDAYHNRHGNPSE